MNRKVISGILTVGAVIAVFVMLLRGCMAKHDQRFKDGKAFIVTTADGDALLTLVQKRKTISYSTGGGMTRTSYNTTLWLQLTKLSDGEVIRKKKLTNMSRIKNHPARLWGVSGSLVWGFINEVKAYDTETLEKKFDRLSLEALNPVIAGKMPKESHYYEPDIEGGFIRFTSLNGYAYRILAADGKIVPEPSPVEKKDEASALGEMLAVLNDLLDSAYKKQQQVTSDRVSKKISSEMYEREVRAYMHTRDSVFSVRDSLYLLQRNAEADKNDRNDYISEIAGYRSLSNYDLSGITLRTDTFGGRMFGLFTEQEAAGPDGNFRIERNSNEKERTLLVVAELLPGIAGNDRKYATADLKVMMQESFLKGGFLVDFKTARALHLSDPSGFIILSSDVIGSEGKMRVTRVSTEGRSVWQVQTRSPVSTKDVLCNGKYLVLFAGRNEGSSNADVMTVIQLDSGAFYTFDFRKNGITGN